MADKIDLSTAPDWRGIRPGMPRKQVMEVLETATAEVGEEDEGDPGWVLARTDEWAMELRFEEGGEQRLRQIALDDWECTWNGREICNRPLHEVLGTLGDAARNAAWRPEDGVNEPFEDLLHPAVPPASDEDLLREGTLWLRSRGLGLVMVDGTVNEVVWRRAEDLPTQVLGPITDSQVELSKRPDLADHLVARPSQPRTKSNPVQKVLTLLLVAALGWVAIQGFHEAQRWQNAQMIKGSLVDIEKATRKPWVDRYKIEYVDPEGHRQIASIERGGFYVPPREKGEEATIAFLPGTPPRVKGPSHARDSAFLEYVPLFIGITAGYVLLWSVAGFVGRLLKRRGSASLATRHTTGSSGPPQPFTPDRGR